MFKLFSPKYEMQHDLSHLSDENQRNLLIAVYNYRKNISQLKIASQYKAKLTQIDKYIDEMYEFAKHIDAFNRNELIKRDALMVPLAIKEVQEHIKSTKDTNKLKDLERQLNLLQQQRANLEQAKNTMKIAATRFHELFSLVQSCCLEILAG